MRRLLRDNRQVIAYFFVVIVALFAIGTAIKTQIIELKVVQHEQRIIDHTIVIKRGDTGPTGVQGVAGPRGRSGATGAPGRPGAVGPRVSLVRVVREAYRA